MCPNRLRSRHGDVLKRVGAACLLLSAILLPVHGEVCTWTGSWDNTPDSADDVVIISSGGDLTWDASLATNVASWTQQNTYSNTVTFDTRYPGQGSPTNITITGDCVISNGTWTHTANTGTETYRLCVWVGGDLAVGSNALINVNEKGYSSGGFSTSAYGGRASYSGGGTYGSITAPTHLGARFGGKRGGGAAKITVQGAAVVDGTISSKGQFHWDSWSSPPSGGSIWLVASNLTGIGVIHADGGNGLRAGGGGRVAVTVTGADNFGNVEIRAHGGKDNVGTVTGGAGTVYLRTQGEAEDEGTLLIRNPPSANEVVFTDISTAVTDTDVGEILIADRGRLNMLAGTMLRVGTVWSNGNDFTATAGSTVEFVGTDSAKVYGNSTFMSLICTNVDKQIEFATNSTTSVEEVLALRGNVGTTNLLLRSMSTGTPWALSVGGATVQDVFYVDVKDSNADPGATAVAFNSTDSGNNSNWVFSTAGLTNTWIGTTSTEWANSANWDLGRAPMTPDDKTIISNGIPFYPILPSDQTLNKLEIMSGASLDLAGNDLTLNDDLTCAGALVASATETVTLKGDADFTGGVFTQATSTVLLAGATAQSVTPGGNSFHQLTATNSGRVVTFVDEMTTDYLLSESVSLTFGTNVTAGEYRVHSDATVVTQQFAAGSTFTVTDLVLPGNASDSIVLRSSSAGNQWRLDVTRSEYVKNVDVKDSNADGGRPIYPIASTDSLNNSNWVFDAAWRIWDGSESSVFGNTNNWTPAGPITATNRALIDGNYANAPDVTAATSVLAVVVGPTAASALTISDALTVGEDFNIFGNGSVTANAALVVSNDMTMIEGALLTHSPNVATEQYKLDVTIAGDLAIDAGAQVNVNEKGYSSGGLSQSSYGGRGSYNAGGTYGSITAPTDLGARFGGKRGGGAAKITVQGAAVVDGTISSKGQFHWDSWSSPPSGGSVWLIASNLTGSGIIHADGGDGLRAGGGGRVAVTVTGAGSFGNVEIRAHGGKDNVGTVTGGAGTVYLRAQGEAEDEGTLLIRNPPSANEVVFTDISTAVTDTDVGKVLIADRGRLNMLAGTMLRVGTVWSNGNDFTATAGSTVEFVTTNTAKLYGDNTFKSLICTNLGKEIQFEAASTIAVEELLAWQGEPTTNLLLRSSASPAQWRLIIGPAAVQDIRYVDVKDSDASAGVTAVGIGSTDSLNNTNWLFQVPGMTNTWIGVTSTNWATSTNWDLARAPHPADDKTVVSNGCAFYPTLPSAQALNKLELLSGSLLRLAGKDLTANNTFICAGTVIATNTETVTLKADVDFTGGTFTEAKSTVVLADADAQSVAPAGNSFFRMTVTNADRVATFTDGMSVEYLRSESVSLSFDASFAAGEYRVNSGATIVTQLFAAGSTCTVDDFVMVGASSNSIVLKSSSDGSPWHLDVSQSEFARNVKVQDSHADGGMTIYPMTSTDVSNNSNWVFNATWRMWDGSESSVFGNTNNWTPAGVVDASTRALIDGSYASAPVISAPASAAAIVIGPTASSALTIGDTLTVGADLNIFGYGTVTSDDPVTVGANMALFDGAWLTHTANGAAEDYKINYAIGGNLAIYLGAMVNADSRGYSSGAPGSGSYGGQRGQGIGNTYGSVVAPTDLGSVGLQSQPGGGAICFNVSGATVLDGTLSVNGGASGDHNGSGASGGSVWITSGTLSGDGVIRSNGGVSGPGANSGGGGGRISVVLTSGGFGAVSMTAVGNNDWGGNPGYGGAGTIYKASGASQEVRMDNGGNGATGHTHLPPSHPTWPFSDNLAAATVHVSAGAELGLTTNIKIRTLVVDSASERLDLGDAGDTLFLDEMTINGTEYTEAGTYTSNDWNGFATPVNVAGDGQIQIAARGTILILR